MHDNKSEPKCVITELGNSHFPMIKRFPFVFTHQRRFLCADQNKGTALLDASMLCVLLISSQLDGGEDNGVV